MTCCEEEVPMCKAGVSYERLAPNAKRRCKYTYLEDVCQRGLCRPVFLEGIDTDVAVACYVGVVDLRQEESSWW